MKTKELEYTGRYHLAEFISKLTNPTILAVLMLLVILFTKADRTIDLIWWSVTLVFLLVILPLFYVYFVVFTNPKYRQNRPSLTHFLKRHPKDILALGLICGLPCWLVLKYLSAPSIMMDTMTALLVIAVIVALVNLFYRASFHLAAITTLVYMCVISWGYSFLILVVLIPMVAWAKYKINDHTRVQLVTGFVLAVTVTSIITFL